MKRRFTKDGLTLPLNFHNCPFFYKVQEGSAVIPQYPRRIGYSTPMDTKIHDAQVPGTKMLYYWTQPVFAACTHTSPHLYGFSILLGI